MSFPLPTSSRAEWIQFCETISFLSNFILFSSERERSPLKERNSNKYGSPSKQFGSPGKQSVASPGKLGSPNKRDVPITRSPAKHTQVGILLQSD